MPIANSSIFLEQTTKQALWKQTSTQQLLVFTILQSAHCVLKSITSWNNNVIIHFLPISREAAIAQWLERLSSKQEVMSSILIGGYIFLPHQQENKSPHFLIPTNSISGRAEPEQILLSVCRPRFLRYRRFQLTEHTPEQKHSIYQYQQVHGKIYQSSPYLQNMNTHIYIHNTHGVIHL